MIKILDIGATADECRAELIRESYSNPTIRKVMDAARCAGFSGEDTYAILAYHLCVVADKYQRGYLEQLQMTVAPHVVISTNTEGLVPK